MNARDICDHIESQVASGALSPGTRLSSERVLSKLFSCSRQTVREAVAELRSRGIVETRHGQGTTVLGLVIQPVANQALEEFYTVYPRILFDILDMRELLESKAAFLAAERATLKDRFRIEKAYNTMLDTSQAARTPDIHSDADFAFHKSIAEASHNPVLAHTLDSLSRLFAKSVRASVDNLYGRPEKRAEIIAQHQNIFEAIIAGDAIAAEKAATEHIKSVRANLEAIEIEESSLVRR